MTIVSRIPGLRLLKVKQNCFNPKSKQAYRAAVTLIPRLLGTCIESAYAYNP
jgi:urate oxidase